MLSKGSKSNLRETAKSLLVHYIRESGVNVDEPGEVESIIDATVDAVHDELDLRFHELQEQVSDIESRLKSLEIDNLKF